MRGIHGDALCRQLLLQALGCHGIAEKQRPGVLVVHKIALRVPVRQRPAVFHGLAVIRRVFPDRDAVAPQKLLFPLLRVCRHVYDDLIADGGAHDADAQTEIAGRADLNRILPKKLPAFLRREPFIAVLRRQKTVLQRQLLRMLQNLVNAAARLHGAGDRQMAVLLEQERTPQPAAIALVQQRLHARDRRKRRFDQAARLLGLREARPDKRREALQSPLCILDVLHGQLDVPHGLITAGFLRIHPEHFASGAHFAQNRHVLLQLRYIRH